MWQAAGAKEIAEWQEEERAPAQYPDERQPTAEQEP
jgi:hypothetical protein